MSVPAAYAGVILIWSTTPLAIQWSSEGGGFLFGVTARMVIGLVFCLLLIGITGVGMPWHAKARGAYLALFGSVLGFFWYFYLLGRMEAVKVNLLTLVTPVTALLLGHWLNGEAIISAVWAGTALILAGLAMHQWDLLCKES